MMTIPQPSHHSSPELRVLENWGQRTWRAYVVHNVDGIEDLLANLETAKSEVVVVQELVEEDVGLSRKRRLWRPRKRRLKKK